MMVRATLGPRFTRRPELWLWTRVALRLEQAAATLRAKPMERHSLPDRWRSSMPEPKADFWEMWNSLTTREQREAREAEINATRVQPSSQQITDMDEALGWVLFWLDDARDTQICMGVARGHSFRRVAKFDGRDPKTIKAIWIRSCEQIAKRLSM